MSGRRDIIGISIENTLCRAVYINDNNVYELFNMNSESVFPSTVTVLPEDILVANPYSLQQYPQSTITRSFCLLGKKFTSEEVENERLCSLVPIETDSENNIVYHLEKVEKEYWSVRDVISTIAKYLISECEKMLGIQVSRCVLSIPDDYTESEMDCYKSTVEQTGVYVEEMVRNSICIGYSLKADCFNSEISNRLDNCNLVIYRIGGTHFMCSVINMVDGHPELLAETCNTSISMDVFVYCIENHFRMEIMKRYQCDLYAGEEGSLQWIKESLKVRKSIREWLVLLNDTDSFILEIPFSSRRLLRQKGMENVEEMEIDRLEIKKLLQKYVEMSIQLVQLTIQKANLFDDQIFTIVPVGATSNLFFVRDELLLAFGDKVYRQQLYNNITAKGLGEYIFMHYYTVC